LSEIEIVLAAPDSHKGLKTEEYRVWFDCARLAENKVLTKIARGAISDSVQSKEDINDL